MGLSVTDIQPFLTGDNLREAMKMAKEKREPIAEGFLYDKTILMISGDPGIGKSTLFAQMAIELAAGLPLFGQLPVQKPIKVLLAPAERSVLEVLERIDVIGEVYPIAKDNLFVTDEFQKLNMLNPAHPAILIEAIKRDCPSIKVGIFDPIYAMVSGGLKEEAPAAAFTHAMSLVQKEFGCTLCYGHHNTKPQYNQHGEPVEKDDPFYGSIFLKAHATGAYLLKRREDKRGAVYLKKKDNYDLLLEKIELEYDSQTGLSHFHNEDMPAAERVRNFLDQRLVDGKTFYFNDLQVATKLCRKTLCTIILHSSLKDRFFVVSSKRNKNLYKSCTAEKSCAV